mmetsp:Transcript_16721/g.34448  ORF Transcript_16721/g.34448 Transcript_16721/m.34448 type:complete len:310 (-) Transcript_16721:596-1525(-)|eukprot:CAMPEP_0168265032 /NCGR_PEP_ID=MMETSP0141_2-20121125/11517_1 /TAXON_ID=44445 /ORGANISM="Pseudo-nitzschia australis, Strain 10249 10 AB" /LENGTH=309 /DNA_ID=CAMNT_0008204463 /DNA_START=31 /DNA_END=960 /DNA_ORIENTATION=+
MASEPPTPEPEPAAIIEGIYVAEHSAARMKSKETALLIPGGGIYGDRYATKTGTYSAKFFSEPGRQLTMISSEGIEEAFERTGMAPLGNIGAELRRNLVLGGISARDLNETIGHEVLIGERCRVFVHRRCVPCKYREAACKRSGLMNNLWGVCGVNCEVLPPLPAVPSTATETETATETANGTIEIGDRVAILPGTYQPERIDCGRMKPGSFIRPADRTLEDVQKMIAPPFIVALAALWDPEGFRRVEAACNSVGQSFWSSEAYPMGLFAATMRFPFLVILTLISASFAVAIVTSIVDGDSGAAVVAEL